MLESFDLDRIKEMYENSAVIQTNLLPETISPYELISFWRLWLNKEYKSYINVINKDSHAGSIRFLIISYSLIYKKIIYLDIYTQIEQINGKIIYQHDKVQMSTFLAHFLSPIKLLLNIATCNSNRVKVDIFEKIRAPK